MRRKMLFFALVLIMALQAAIMMPAAQADTGDHFNILLLGSDSTHETVQEASNADAIILASLNIQTGALKMINIQRDIMVELPDGLGVGGLGSAASLGGPPMALKAVNSLLALDTPYYVQVDMAGVEKIVDALNGLEVDVPENELHMLLPDGVTKIFEKSGMQTLSTQQVMAYIQNQPMAGIAGRTERIIKVLHACLSKGMNLDLGSLLDLASELLNYVQTNMTLNDMFVMAMSVLSVDFAGIETAQFPMKAYAADQGNVIAPDQWTKDVLDIHTFLYETGSP